VPSSQDIDGESSTKRQAVGDAKPTTSQARAKVARDASLALATPNINEKTVFSLVSFLKCLFL